MTQGLELPSPMMRRTAGFHANLGSIQPAEELEQLPAPQLLAQNRLLRRIHTVQLKNTLGRVHTNADKLVHGRLPCLRSHDLTLADSMPWGAVHTNSNHQMSDRGETAPNMHDRRLLDRPLLRTMTAGDNPATPCIP